MSWLSKGLKKVKKTLDKNNLNKEAMLSADPVSHTVSKNILESAESTGLLKKKDYEAVKDTWEAVQSGEGTLKAINKNVDLAMDKLKPPELEQMDAAGNNQGLQEAQAAELLSSNESAMTEEERRRRMKSALMSNFVTGSRGLTQSAKVSRKSALGE